MTGSETKIRTTKDDQQTATEEQACNQWGTVVVRWGIVPTPKQVWGRHTTSAMDFSRAGVVKPAGESYRVHVQWRGNTGKRDIYGPRRPDKQTAQLDLESMRAAASGMGREDGFAAMEAEAKRLRDGKAPKEEGSVEPTGMGFRARLRWMDGGEERRAYGPRRSEKRRAEEDLEVMREASSRHEDVLSRRKAVTAEARRLQQLAEQEVKVSVVARRLSQEKQQQPVSTAQKPQQLSNALQHPIEDCSDDSQSDWEIGERDDADVVYAWERFDDRGRPLPEQQQQPVATSVSQPEPKTPDEATAMLSKFRAIRSTPEDLQRLLEARADPNMTVGEGNISPMENIMTFAREIHVPIRFHMGPMFPCRRLRPTGPSHLSIPGRADARPPS